MGPWCRVLSVSNHFPFGAVRAETPGTSWNCPGFNDTKSKFKPPLSLGYPTFGRHPGIAARTQFTLKTVITRLPCWLLPRDVCKPCSQAGHNLEQLCWPGRSAASSCWGLRPRSLPQLWGSWCRCRKHSSSCVDRCCRQELRSLGRSCCAVFNASLVKVLSGTEDSGSP